MGTHAAAPALYSEPDLRSREGLRAGSASSAESSPEVLAVRKDFPANNLQEFVAYAKANEGKINAAHAGVGSVSYVGCLLLHHAIGIHPTRLVLFTGNGTGLDRHAGRPGRLRLRVIRSSGRCRVVRAGAVKALAIASKHRQLAAARGADLCRTGPAGVRLRAVLCRVRTQGHAAGCDRPPGRRCAQQRARRGRSEEAPQRPRHRDRDGRTRRGLPQALAALVHSEVAWLTPIPRAGKLHRRNSVRSGLLRGPVRAKERPDRRRTARESDPAGA